MLGALIGGGISIIGGLIKTSQANKQRKKVEEALDAYRMRDLENVAESLTVSTEGADYQRDLLATLNATKIDALRKSGTRGLVGGLSEISKTSTEVGDKIKVDLDTQRQNIDKMIAEDDVRIRTLQEERQKADLAGLGTALNVSKQDSMSGISDIFSGVGSIAMGGLFGGGGESSSMFGSLSRDLKKGTQDAVNFGYSS